MIEGFFEGTTRNQSYCLYDNKDGQKNRKRITMADTIRQCKVEAERVIREESGK
jgi:hypothetical protein